MGCGLTFRFRRRHSMHSRVVSWMRGGMGVAGRAMSHGCSLKSSLWDLLVPPPCPRDALLMPWWGRWGGGRCGWMWMWSGCGWNGATRERGTTHPGFERTIQESGQKHLRPLFRSYIYPFNRQTRASIPRQPPVAVALALALAGSGWLSRSHPVTWPSMHHQPPRIHVLVV